MAALVLGSLCLVVLWLISTIFLTQYCAGGQIEKNEMGKTCGADGGGKRGAQGVGGET
jgi:hypothetical protein